MAPTANNPLTLRAGPLTADFFPEELFLRYVRAGNEECLRGIYLAIRDQDWNTPAPTVELTSSEIRKRSFELMLVARWEQPAIQYRAECRLTGTEAGRIAYHFKGVALSDFLRNRLGFVVLHGAQLAGEAVDVESVEGLIEHSRFPNAISPHQPFQNIRAMTHNLNTGQPVEVVMEGDTFETEDQRNWTDASFKTYCTPLRLPFPVRIRTGAIVEQSITVQLKGTTEPANNRKPNSAVELRPTAKEQSYPIPPIGLETATPGAPALSETVLQTLAALELQHLRVSLNLADSDALEKLCGAQEEAIALGCSLEVALFASEGDDLKGFSTAARKQLNVPVARWMVFDPSTKTTPAARLAATRAALVENRFRSPVGAGTDHFFAELNRDRAAIDGADYACFSINPQVHAFDDLSLIETLEMQGVCVKSAQAFAEGRPVVVSPLTFKMRSNPNATATSKTSTPDSVSSRIDPRQSSSFGAVWTLGSLLYLTAAEIGSVTLFELTGPLGVIAPSGETLPVYDAIALFSRSRGGRLRPLDSSDPSKAIGFDLLDPNGDPRFRVVANLAPKPQRICCGGKDRTFDVYEYKTWPH